jgi:hypothetical protein
MKINKDKILKFYKEYVDLFHVIDQEMNEESHIRYAKLSNLSLKYNMNSEEIKHITDNYSNDFDNDELLEILYQEIIIDEKDKIIVKYFNDHEQIVFKDGEEFSRIELESIIEISLENNFNIMITKMKNDSLTLWLI